MHLDAIESFVPGKTIFFCRNTLSSIHDKELRAAMEEYLNELETIKKDEKSAFIEYAKYTTKVYNILNKRIDEKIEEIDRCEEQKKISFYCGEYLVGLLDLLKESNEMLIKFISTMKESLKNLSEDARLTVTTLSEYAAEVAVLLNKDIFTGKEFGEETAKSISNLMNRLHELILGLKIIMQERPALKPLSPLAKVILREYPI